jgi:integrase
MTTAKRDTSRAKPQPRLAAAEQRPVERRFKERRQRGEAVTVERRFHARRKSYEIPVDEALRRLPKASQTAMAVKDISGEQIDFVAAITKPHERFRTQKGELITYTDGIYLRYYAANRNGQRMKVAEPLCPVGTSDRDAEKLKRKRMAAVNLEQRSQFFTPTAEGMTVAAFWEALYYPLIKENKSFSTALTYKRIWDAYLEPHFRAKSLERYSTEQAFDFMESLATRKTAKGRGLGRNSLSLCRAICYGIFNRARSKGLLAKDANGQSRNPWEGLASPDVKIRPQEKLVTYTLAEVAKVVQELPRTDAKLLFSFCSLLGMRPSEAGAVKWEDITPDTIHISRSAPRGHEQSVMKSKRSERSFELIRPVAWLVDKYLKELIEAAHGHKPSGYLFKRRNGSVINVSDFAQYHIARHGEKAIGERWAGLYAGRRAVGTAAYNLTGDTRAAFQLLGNTKETSVSHYIAPDVEQGKAGLRLLESAYEIEVAKLTQAG